MWDRATPWGVPVHLGGTEAARARHPARTGQEHALGACHAASRQVMQAGVRHRSMETPRGRRHTSCKPDAGNRSPPTRRLLSASLGITCTIITSGSLWAPADRRLASRRLWTVVRGDSSWRRAGAAGWRQACTVAKRRAATVGLVCALRACHTLAATHGASPAVDPQVADESSSEPFRNATDYYYTGNPLACKAEKP